MSARRVCLAAEDAVELAELLAFLTGWIDHDARRVSDALVGFCAGYDAAALRADLARFAFLLGGADPSLVFGPEGEQKR